MSEMIRYSTGSPTNEVDVCLEHGKTQCLIEVSALLTEVKDLREKISKLVFYATDGGKHDPDMCPTWYDGCNCGIVHRLENENAALRTTGQALIDRLKEISEHPSYLGQIAMAHVHGYRYDGPTWEVPGNNLAEAIHVSTLSEFMHDPAKALRSSSEPSS